MGRRKEELQVKIPSYFRCPISLDVMKSPVSLCTGVTYDRSSIQRWLEGGNNTCPATMQVLPSTEMVPNHTLHRLIKLWSTTTITPPRSSQLLRQIHTSTDPLPSLRLLASTPPSDLSAKASSVPIITSVLTREPPDPSVNEAAVRILALLLPTTTTNIKLMARTQPLMAIISVLTSASSLDSRTDAAKVLEAIASADADSRLAIAGADGAIDGIARLVMDETRSEAAMEAGLSCLAEISVLRCVRAGVVAAGLVGAMGRVLQRKEGSVAVAEKAIKVLEQAVTCAEGRAAVCEDARHVIGAVVEWMMRLSREGRETAVVVLWSVCRLYADRRAQDAVAEDGGLTKILMVMQSGCSATTRQMAGDLLRISRVYSNSCLANYDSKTLHIMPF